ncbi:hypothetical protein M422DRAFT_201775 [Sphaerobolus stellatus SS14]|nr:hypothetical protein M422DRAFT_201775 [Sphaerobolus stellatus SS14]
MLNLSALRTVLSSVVSPPRLHTVVLFTPSGDLIAHAESTQSSRDNMRLLVGVAAEVWATVREEGVGMVESELGKILVMPVYAKSPQQSRVGRSSSRSTGSKFSPEDGLNPPFIIALNATDDVEWAEMLIKSRGIVNHLSGPLAVFGDSLTRTPSLPASRIPGRFFLS